MKHLLSTLKVEVEKITRPGLSLKPKQVPGAWAGLGASAGAPVEGSWMRLHGLATLIELTVLPTASYCQSGTLMPVPVTATERVSADAAPSGVSVGWA